MSTKKTASDASTAEVLRFLRDHAATKEDLAGVTKELRAGFAGVNQRLGNLESGQHTIAEVLGEVAEGLEALTEICKKGFDATPSREEFDAFRTLVEKRHYAFARKLGLDLAQIDAAA